MSLEDDSKYNINSQPENNHSWLSIEVYIKANQPELLRGLDQWLALGLISHTQVIKICRQNLSCALPEITAAIVPKLETAESIATAQELVETASPRSVISRIWQGFLDELSIRWLLFLGIFLVIVSSGVLAASQWDNFPRLGQYLILLVYTVGFWGISFWSSKQENLKLTTQTLRAIAILLVPINCWAISHFGLGNSLGEWITLVIASIILTVIIFDSFKLSQKENNSWFIPLFLILSYLHLIWQFLPFPLIVIYGAIIIISLIHYLFFLPKNNYPIFNLLFLLSAWWLILVRTLLTQEYLIADAASAIALFAWILATIYLTQEKQAIISTTDHELNLEQLNNTFWSKILQVISIILLGATWSISILAGILDSPLFFWQTVAISVLAIHLFSQRLTLYWRKRDLTAIFAIGLQTVWISKELIPDSFRSNALNLAVTISKTEYLPESVLGVTLFPYVILFVAVASWLYRRQKIELAQYAETLTLLLGIALTSLSLSNPIWRSLNLLFSTLTLGYVTSIRQPLRVLLIYITHLLSLVTIVNGIDVMLPNLSQPVWGSILVLLMTGEWFVYSQLTSKDKDGFLSTWIKSSWYAGLLLAATSYLCFSSNLVAADSAKLINVAVGLIWLITPGMLTRIAKHTRQMNLRRTATTFSCVALICAQILLLAHPLTRLIGLTVAIALMLANIFYLRRSWVTGLHLGFGLGLIASLLNSLVNNENWLIVGGLLILGLNQFRFYLTEIADTPKFDYISQRMAIGILGVGRETQNYKLINQYIQAADNWAIALIAINTAILSISYPDIANCDYYPQYLLTAGLILAGVIWRYRHHLNNLVLYTVAWLVELLAVATVAYLGGGNLSFAIANILLGLFSCGLIQRIAKTNSAWANLNLNLNLTYIPLIYAALAVFWRLPLYNTYTGWLTLATAFILLNTPQINRQINLFTKYLGFLGISVGIYEIVIEQMQQSSGSSIADGMTILALVAATIAFGYRLGAWWYSQRQHQTIFNLRLSKVVFIAHIHWAISSILKIIAASIAIETTSTRLTPVSIATSFCLGAYAVIQGRDRHPETSKTTNDWWVYVGLVEITATLVYSRLIIHKLSFFDPGRVIFTCAIAALIYQIPWQNFGWRVTPWQRVALVTPALMALVTAEDISYFSLLVTAVFYLRIAYVQKNLRWSYISLGLINWGMIRLIWQFNTEFIWLASIMSLSILYLAQFDPYFTQQPQPRHFLRLLGCGIICAVALFYQDPGTIPGVISLILILIGLGLRIRALLFSGTITLILTVIYQLITLVAAYSFLKWVVGLLVGILAIVVAAGFEKNRDRLTDKLKNYHEHLQNWQ